MIAHLDGDFETVDYAGDRSILIYDNVETEEYPLHWHNAIEIIMAKAEGRYKGRKPIAVDESLFDSVVTLWQGGQITAREAMSRLNLKPNTFYRRIKEREEQKMKDYKMAQREIRDEIRAAAKQSRRDLEDLRKQVHEEAKEVKKAADEKLELRDVEREMRHDRQRAETQYQETVRQMKKDVKAEAEQLKKLMESES